MTDNTKKLFVSCSGDSHGRCEKLSEFMKFRGINVQCSDDSMKIEDILTVIRECRNAAVFFSRESDKSQRIAIELAAARENGKALFCLKTDGAEPDDLKSFFDEDKRLLIYA